MDGGGFLFTLAVVTNFGTLQIICYMGRNVLFRPKQTASARNLMSSWNSKKDYKRNILICLLIGKKIIILYSMKLKFKGSVIIKAL